MPLIGGAQTVYDAMAREMPDELSVLTASSNYVSGESVDGITAYDAKVPYKIHRIPEMRPPLVPNPSFFGRVRHKIKSYFIKKRVLKAAIDYATRDEVDCIIIGALDSLGWLGEAIRNKTGLPYSIYVHGEEVSQDAYNTKAMALRKQALDKADKIIAVSEFTKDILVNKYYIPSHKISVITNGVDISRFPRCEDVSAVRSKYQSSNGHLVVSVGRLVERKGFDKLIEAWPLVLDVLPDSKLVIVGDGELSHSIKTTIDSDKRLSQSVTMTGRLSDQGMGNALQASDLFIMPNRTMPDGDTEGFGMVFLEASACGLPVIAGRAGGAVEAVRDGDTGLLVDGYNVNEIVGSIVKLLKDDKLAQQMAAAGRKFAASQSWQSKALQLKQLLVDMSNQTHA